MGKLGRKFLRNHPFVTAAGVLIGVPVAVITGITAPLSAGLDILDAGLITAACAGGTSALTWIGSIVSDAFATDNTKKHQNLVIVGSAKDIRTFENLKKFIYYSTESYKHQEALPEKVTKAILTHVEDTQPVLQRLKAYESGTPVNTIPFIRNVFNTLGKKEERAFMQVTIPLAEKLKNAKEQVIVVPSPDAPSPKKNGLEL